MCRAASGFSAIMSVVLTLNPSPEGNVLLRMISCRSRGAAGVVRETPSSQAGCHTRVAICRMQTRIALVLGHVPYRTAIPRLSHCCRSDSCAAWRRVTGFCRSSAQKRVRQGLRLVRLTNLALERGPFYGSATSRRIPLGEACLRC